MEGRVLSMLIMVSIMFLQPAVAQEEEDFGLNNGDYWLHSLEVDMLPESPPLPPESETPLFPGDPLPFDFSPPSPVLDPNPLPFDPATPSIPDSPSPPATLLPSPGTPLSPPPPPETCEDKCTKKCSRLIIGIVLKLCFKACKLGCSVIQSELIYNCTKNCAQSMPVSLTSDAEQMDSYVNACYQKCKNHN